MKHNFYRRSVMIVNNTATMTAANSPNKINSPRLPFWCNDESEAKTKHQNNKMKHKTIENKTTQHKTQTNKTIEKNNTTKHK